MTMKFHLLPIGQQFEWEGNHYVKTKPLIARQLPNGGDKFIPRSALVNSVLEKSPAPPAQVEPVLDSGAVAAALAEYHQLAQQLIDNGNAQRREQLEAAYRALLEQLKL